MNEPRQEGPWVKLCDLFAGLPRSVYANILGTAIPREYNERQVIFRIADPINEILLLTHGRAKITQLDRDGNEVILRLVAPSEIVGVLALQKGDVYRSTAHAVEACRVLAWDAVAFEAASEKFPVLQRNAIRVAAQRLYELEKRFCEVSTEKLSLRLARVLDRLVEQIGHRVNDDYEIKLSQGALAQMIASDVWSVNRVLSSWKNQGLISLRRSTIVIRNYEGLLAVDKSS
jgi:CRP-like cAMP-binding protein